MDSTTISAFLVQRTGQINVIIIVVYNYVVSLIKPMFCSGGDLHKIMALANRYYILCVISNHNGLV